MILNYESANGTVEAEIGALNSIYDVLRYTRGIARKFGYQYYSIMRLHNQNVSSFSDISVVNNWPTEVVAVFDDLQHAQINQIVDSIRNANLPFSWQLSDLGKLLTIGEFEDASDIFENFSFTAGAFFPVYCPKGRLGAVSFMGDRVAPDTFELASLSYISTQIYDQVETILGATESPRKADLSARENECLRWTAQGKTSSEIAKLMTLSEHTVKHYLVSICQKLNAHNRTQAVANAIRAGLLD